MFFRLSYTTCNCRCCGSSLIIATPGTYVGTSMYIMLFDLKSYILVFDLKYYMQLREHQRMLSLQPIQLRASLVNHSKNNPNMLMY